jgi:outer membrane protein, heavy metal efflux system
MSCRLAFALGVAAIGCASTSPKEPFEEVSQLVDRHLGHPLRWRTGGPEDQAIDHEVQDLLGRELTADGATQVALLNNRELLATYEELGVAQADLVQAGLLLNPSLGASVRLPVGGKGVVDSDFSVVEDFLDLLVLPLRRRMARAELRATELRVGAKVLAVASQVKEACYRLQASEQIQELRQSVADAESASMRPGTSGTWSS